MQSFTWGSAPWPPKKKEGTMRVEVEVPQPKPKLVIEGGKEVLEALEAELRRFGDSLSIGALIRYYPILAKLYASLPRGSD